VASTSLPTMIGPRTREGARAPPQLPLIAAVLTRRRPRPRLPPATAGMAWHASTSAAVTSTSAALTSAAVLFVVL
jgi:hypothetical protein